MRADALLFKELWRIWLRSHNRTLDKPFKPTEKLLSRKILRPISLTRSNKIPKRKKLPSPTMRSQLRARKNTISKIFRSPFPTIVSLWLPEHPVPANQRWRLTLFLKKDSADISSHSMLTLAPLCSRPANPTSTRLRELPLPLPLSSALLEAGVNQRSPQ